MMAWLAFLWNSPVSEFPARDDDLFLGQVKRRGHVVHMHSSVVQAVQRLEAQLHLKRHADFVKFKSVDKNNLKIHACFQHWKHMQRSPWNHIHLGYTDYTPLESCEHRICSKLWLCGEELQRTFSTFSAFSPFTFAAGRCVQGTRKKEYRRSVLNVVPSDFHKMSQWKSMEKSGKVKAFKACSCLGGDGSWAHGKEKKVAFPWCQNEMTLGTGGRQKRQETPWTWFIWLCFTVVFQRYLQYLHIFMLFFIVSFPSCSFIFHELYFNLRTWPRWATRVGGCACKESAPSPANHKKKTRKKIETLNLKGTKDFEKVQNVQNSSLIMLLRFTYVT